MLKKAIQFSLTIPDRLVFYAEFFLFLFVVLVDSIFQFICKWAGLLFDKRNVINNLDYPFVRDNIISNLCNNLEMTVDKAIEVFPTSVSCAGAAPYADHVTFRLKNHPFVESICVEFCKTAETGLFKFAQMREVKLKNQKFSKLKLFLLLRRVVSIVLRSTNHSDFRKTHDYSLPFFDFHANMLMVLALFRSWHMRTMLKSMSAKSINFARGSLDFSWESFESAYCLKFEDDYYELGIYSPQNNATALQKAYNIVVVPFHCGSKKELLEIIQEAVHRVESY